MVVPGAALGNLRGPVERPVVLEQRQHSGGRIARRHAPVLNFGLGASVRTPVAGRADPDDELGPPLGRQRGAVETEGVDEVVEAAGQHRCVDHGDRTLES